MKFKLPECSAFKKHSPGNYKTEYRHNLKTKWLNNCFNDSSSNGDPDGGVT